MNSAVFGDLECVAVSRDDLLYVVIGGVCPQERMLRKVLQKLDQLFLTRLDLSALRRSGQCNLPALLDVAQHFLYDFLVALLLEEPTEVGKYSGIEILFHAELAGQIGHILRVDQHAVALDLAQHKVPEELDVLRGELVWHQQPYLGCDGRIESCILGLPLGQPHAGFE